MYCPRSREGSKGSFVIKSQQATKNYQNYQKRKKRKEKNLPQCNMTCKQLANTMAKYSLLHAPFEPKLSDLGLELIGSSETG
jgi:hypothetical protein